MTALNKQVLRQIAESVDREEWDVLDNGDADYQVIVNGSLERGATYRSYKPVTNEISNKKIAAFIAAFNPKVALALLDEVDSAEHTSAVDHEAACSLVEENEELKRRIAEQEAKLETADKLQDSAFRDGLKAGFSYGQTDDQSGFAQCMSAYSTRAGIKVKG
ncbi:ead/Ea22-like family protein [Salmonella enterica subsp. enterica serovar Anecho]|nr:ead/Ea22-like family protein [Salmonella enterica subsp. enterica serovar Anecho]